MRKQKRKKYRYLRCYKFGVDWAGGESEAVVIIGSRELGFTWFVQDRFNQLLNDVDGF